MDLEEIKGYILENFEGTSIKETYGEISFFYNPGNALPSGTYFMTIKERDGPNDKASDLDREGIFRVNVGASKETFLGLFGEIPKRPPKGGIIAGQYEFTKLDTIMPHPVYGWAYWICVLNPKKSTFERLVPFIHEYYQQSRKRFEKRIRKLSEE